MPNIQRMNDEATIKVTDDLSTTQHLNFQDAVLGGIAIPAASDLTGLDFYCSTKVDGEYLPVLDRDQTAITLTVTAGNNYLMPTDLSRCRFIKIVGTFGSESEEVVNIDIKA